MAYLYLIIVTVLFSFGGMLIKVSGIMFSPYMISFLCFAIGVMGGFSYGNVVIWPIQTLTVLIVSVLIFKEKITKRSLIGTIFSLMGIGMISWNGVSLETFLGGQVFLLLSFAAAGVCSLILPVQGNVVVGFHVPAMITMLILGVITGVGFFWLRQ